MAPEGGEHEGPEAQQAAAAPAPRRWQRFREAADALPPMPGEMAWATLIGAPVLALANVVSIVVALPMPAEGVGLRVLHLSFALLTTLGMASLLALPLALVERVRPRLPRLPEAVGWTAMTAVTALAMYGVLSTQLERQANAALDGFAAGVLYPLYILLCAMAVPAAFILGAFFTRLGALRWLGMASAVVGMAVGHAILRDDYPGVHAAVLWVAMLLFGGSAAQPAIAWLRRRAWRSKLVVAAAAALALAAVAIAPPNRVRQELFRDPGAVAAWAMAQLWWRPPATPAAEPPRLADYPPAVMEGASKGLPSDPVVVLLTIDALRGDVIADEGNDSMLRRFAWLRRQSAYFPNAVSPGSQTSVSLTGLFSGRYFSQLYWSPFGEGRQRFLYAHADETERFPRMLSDAGVETSSFIGLVFLQDSFGIARGFEHETILVKGRGHAHVATVMPKLLETLNRHGRGPAFLYAHLMEPHEPYDRGKLKEGSAFDRYKSEVELVDGWISRVVNTLSRRFRDRGYLIVSADHGEAFGEHGTHFHTKTLYQEMIHVPLIVWGPGILPRRLPQRASLIDVGPTVLQLFGLKRAEGMMGRSLLPLARGYSDDLPRPTFAEGRLRRAYLTEDGLKVIEDTVRKVVEVYDLKRDPAESRNLFDSEPERAGPAVAAMRAFFAEHTLKRDGYQPPYKP